MDSTEYKGETMTYETPLGAFSTWEAAAIACERCDLDPCTAIRIVKEVL
jgi:hypothetical protein